VSSVAPKRDDRELGAESSLRLDAAEVSLWGLGVQGQLV
jgi:hypothetical protein